MKIRHLLFGLLGLTACTSDLEEQPATSELESITMSAKDFEYENDKQGRTSFEISNSGAGFTWAANDVVGICPSEGAQLAFPMTEGAGTKTATFTGGGWALMPSAKYMAYYPAIDRMFVDKTAIPVSFENQTQTGVSSTAHLGQCDFMAAAGNTPSSGNVFFNFEHLGSLVEMTITLPRATTYTKVMVSCEEAPVFTTEGKIDLTAAQPTITTVTPSKSFTINLNNFTTTEANQAVKVYFMAAPVNLNVKTVTVDVTSQDSYIYSGSFTSAKDWLAGKAYRCAVTTTETGRIGLPYYFGYKYDQYDGLIYIDNSTYLPAVNKDVLERFVNDNPDKNWGTSTIEELNKKIENGVAVEKSKGKYEILVILPTEAYKPEMIWVTGGPLGGGNTTVCSYDIQVRHIGNVNYTIILSNSNIGWYWVKYFLK